MLACQRTQQVHLLLTVNHPAGSQHAPSSVSLGVTEHLYTIHWSTSILALCVTGALRLPFDIRDCSPLCIINISRRRLEIEARVMGHTLYAVCAKAACVCHRGFIELFPTKRFVAKPTVRAAPVMDKMSGRR